MPNPQYRKGANAERELMAAAVEAGANAYRGAGSHGAYDVVITTREGVRYLVNIKCNRWAPPAERARLLALTNVADRPLLAMKIDRRGWWYRAVNDDGTMGMIYPIAPWQ